MTELEKQVEALKSKHESLQFTVLGHSHRIEKIEDAARATNEEIIKGRELIREQLVSMGSKLDLLHEEHLVRQGREESEKNQSEWTKWIWPLIVSIGSLIIAIIAVYKG